MAHNSILPTQHSTAIAIAERGCRQTTYIWYTKYT